MKSEEKNKQSTILIIDDDIVIRSIAKSIFSNSNFKVIEADSGEMGLEILPSIMPDVVLLDILMPGMDGCEVLKRIRANEKLKLLKVILLSSQNDINERLKGYDLGADSYITKPFIGNELLAKIKVFTKLQHIETENATLIDLINKEVAKRMEQEDYIKTNNKLSEMSNLFVAITHHWRQPLNATSLLIEDIYDAYEHGELTLDYLRHNVQQCIQQISRMSSVINSFSHLTWASVTEELEKLNVLTILSKVFTDFFHLLTTSQITCIVNGMDSLQFIQTSNLEYFVNCDKELLHQIFCTMLLASQNTIDVAEKLNQTKHDSATLHIKLFHDGDTLHFITYTLEGYVLSKDELASAFDPYYILGEGQFAKEGISLYFLKMLIEQKLNGRLYLENGDLATEFHLELPLCK